MNSGLIPIIRNAYERSIVVYDSQGEAGSVTGRLLSLAIEVAWHQLPRGELVELWVPETFMPSNPPEWVRSLGGEQYGELRRFYFDDLGGSLAPGDTEFVIGVGVDGTSAFLGSF